MRVPELLAEPWAATREGYEAIVRSVRAGVDSLLEVKAQAAGMTPEAALSLLDPQDELDVSPQGVAVIPVQGFLTRRAYWRGDRASYAWIGKQVRQAVDRPDVARIVLNIDSGGGQVNGTEDLATLIFEAREAKPITAFVQGQAASAAYWIASAAHRVVAGRTSMLGSIGVIWTFIDWSKYDAELGIQEIDIVSSQSPDKRIDPTTKHGRDVVQATVDQLAGVFVEDVARYRGVSEDTVVQDFGRGWVRVGSGAVDVGLANAIGTFEDAITDDATEAGSGGGTPAASGQEAPMTQINVSEITADWLSENCPQVVAALREGYVAQADHNTALEAARAETPEGVPESAAEAATETERTRILGIQEAARGSGHGDLVKELVADSKISVDQAKARLFEAVQAKRQGQLDALAGDEDDLDAPDPDGDPKGESELADLVKAAGDYATAVNPI